MFHVFLLPWKYIVQVYIEFDSTDYTRCLAVLILSAFKIQNSVSVEGMHNRRKDWSAFAHVKTET